MSNVLYGTDADDVLLGSSGDDIFYVSKGYNKYWGGTGGKDKLVLTGELSNYSVKDNGNGSYTITDMRKDAPDGISVVRAIDTFDTTSGSFSLDEMLAQTVNMIEGTAGNETLLGGNRDDVFTASGGSDRIWGGNSGTDKIIFSGKMSQYSVEDNGNDSYTIVDTREGSPDGEMVIRNIEILEFSDITTDVEEMLANNFNEVTGTSSNDYLEGSVGDDHFYGGAGDDTIWGHTDGVDVARYTGNMEDYKVYTYGDGRFLIKDMRTGAQNDGTDIVRNVEMIQFADQTISLEKWIDGLPITPIIGSLGDENNNVLHGSDKDDVMQAFGGDDRIWAGHEGNDTVIFRGDFSNYIITDNDNGAFTVQDMRDGSPDGTNVVRGFEHFQFADQTVGVEDITSNNASVGADLSGTAAADAFDGAHTDGLFDAHTNDLLEGMMGDDVIKGGPGDDIIYGDQSETAAVGEAGEVVYQDVGSDLPTFDFEGALYQVINGQVKQLNPTTGEYENIGQDHQNFNAIGMRTQDGYAYGIGSNRTDFAGHLIRVGSDGNIETVGTGFQSVAAGTFADDGRLYIRTDKNTLKAINVETLEVEVFDFTGGNASSVYDLVFIDDGAAGKFYGMDKYANLVVFDMNTGTMTSNAIEGIDVTGAFGAGWSADGDLYFSHNKTGNIYGISGIETDRPFGGLLSEGDRSSINDGFSFNDAPLPTEFLVEGSDFLMGGAGNDTLYGGAGNDFLNGGDGADQLIGGQGIDFADYSHSTESVHLNLSTGGETGQAAGDSYESIEGVVGSDFDDVITGSDGDDHLLGYDGNDTLIGGAGNDHLWGEDGNDILVGGTGANHLRGGDGEDIYVLTHDDQTDTIKDFVQGEDIIDLSNISQIEGIDDLTFTRIEESDSNSHVVSYNFEGQTYTINVHSNTSELVKDDFIF